MRLKAVSLKASYDLPMVVERTFNTSGQPRADLYPNIVSSLIGLGFGGFRVPVDLEILPKEEAAFLAFKAEGLFIEAFVCLSQLDTGGQNFSFLLETVDSLEVIVDDLNPKLLAKCMRLMDLCAQRVKLHFSMVITKKLTKSKRLPDLLKTLPQTHFYFVYPKEIKDGLSNRQIYGFMNSLRERGLGSKIAGPRTPLYDSRCTKDTEQERYWEPKFDSCGDFPPKFSFIIPCFNNYDYLKKTLENLLLLNANPAEFEILVIDDGSDSEQVHSIGQWFDGFSKRDVQFKYIYSPRLSPRKMGDGRYRAGISRNLGVSQARGEYLCFLDSDILVPPNYLDLVQKGLEQFDVLQFKRYDLSAKSSHEKKNYSEISEEDLIYEDEYWDQFNASKLSWADTPDGWKYTCTHSLSMKSRTFKESGWILPCFIFYGFEDTELGYRLWSNGLKFGLGSSKVFHFFHKPERSEFLREKWKRDKILSKTAEIFFRHQPHPQIYQIFQSYLR